tara:strand:+ start:2032 stop:2736 length:705 start_codon:yes stop_codon:yes gene_type:complete
MKTAIITGASKGIGFACAKKFVQNNFNVAICARNQESLDKAITLLKAENNKVEVFSQICDVSNKEALNNFVQEVLNKFQSIDVLINNAGVFFPGEVHQEDDGVLEQMIETNLYSAYRLSRAIVPNMKAKKSGYIFNIASIAGLQAYPNGGSYGISKFAMIGMGKALRQELLNFNIKVSNVIPGAVYTASWEGVDLPEERFIKADDIASLIFNAYSLSDSCVVEDIVVRPQLGDI